MERPAYAVVAARLRWSEKYLRVAYLARLKLNQLSGLIVGGQSAIRCKSVDRARDCGLLGVHAAV